MNTDTPPPDESAGDAWERRLAAQPLRGAPSAWRSAILAKAGTATQVTPKPARDRSVRSGWFERWLREYPVTWGALAALWLVVAGLNSVDRWLNGPPVVSARSISTAQWAEIQNQRKELGELAGIELRAPLRPAPSTSREETPAVLRPRSHRRPQALQGLEGWMTWDTEPDGIRVSVDTARV